MYFKKYKKTVAKPPTYSKNKLYETVVLLLFDKNVKKWYYICEYTNAFNKNVKQRTQLNQDGFLNPN